MMIGTFGNCPVCGAELVYELESSTFFCATGHYTVRITAGTTSGTVTLSQQHAPPMPAVEVPKAFHDAFSDREVLEP